MSDPVSAAGTAVGIVSLGLTVCQGLVKYYSTYKSRDATLEAAFDQLEGLASMLELLNSKLKNVPSSYGDVTKEVEEKLTACGSSIAQLETYLSRFRECEAQPRWKDKLRTQKLKVLYPFHQDTLQNLRQLVRDTRDKVTVTLGLFNIVLSIESTNSLSRIEESIPRYASDVSRVHQEELRQTRGELQAFIQDYTRDMALLLARVRLDSESTITHTQSLSGNCDQCLYGIPANSTLGRSISEGSGPLQLEDNSALDVASSVPSMKTDTSIGALCSCRPYRSTRISRKRFAQSVFFSVAEKRYPHEKMCPFFMPSMKKTTFGVTIPSSWLLSKIVGISCTIGHSSISPQLSLRNVVSKNATAFKLVIFLARELTSIHSAEAVLRKLGELFHSGEASLTDTTPWGWTIIHYILEYFFHNSRKWEEVEALLFLLKILKTWGCPLNEVDLYGHTPLMILFDTFISHSFYFHETHQQQIRFLSELIDLGAEGTFPSFFQPDLQSQSMSYRFVSQTRQVNDFSEVFGISELIKAVLMRNMGKMIKVIQKDPSMIQECDSTSLTALHYASNWPEGLKVLLSFSNIYQTGEHIDGRDNQFAPWACACINRNEACLQIFLESGWPLAFPDYSNFHLALHHGSKRQRTILIAELARRREQLQNLAHSAGYPVSNLNLSNGVMNDAEANNVVTWLQARGVAVNYSLRPPVNGKTVFHLTDRLFDIDQWSGVAEELYIAGFRDIDAADIDGNTPLAQVFQESIGLADLKYAGWLVSKGANVESRVYFNLDHQSIRLLDGLAACFGKKLSFELRDKLLLQSSFSRLEPIAIVEASLAKFGEGPTQTLQKILVDDRLDGCNCACSTDGCGTLHRFLMAVLYRWPSEHLQTNSPDRLRVAINQEGALVTMKLAERLNLDCQVQARVSLQILRLSTFNALDLTHTCCSRWRGRKMDEDDVIEIRAEESVSIEKHERLVCELESLWNSCGDSFESFMKDHWEPVLNRELEDEQNRVMSQDEIRQAEAIGVVFEKPRVSAELDTASLMGD